jgi:WD40 repeat protein
VSRFAPGSGEYLATGSFDGSVRFWSARDWSPISCLQAHESKLTGFGAPIVALLSLRTLLRVYSKLTCADLSEDDTKLLTCGYDKTFKQFQAEAFV